MIFVCVSTRLCEKGTAEYNPGVARKFTAVVTSARLVAGKQHIRITREIVIVWVGERGFLLMSDMAHTCWELAVRCPHQRGTWVLGIGSEMLSSTALYG